MKLSKEIFESLSSDVDWCEPNYIYTTHIAEMWNTVSSLSLVLTSLVLMNLYQEYAAKVPNCYHVNYVWFMLLIVGVASIYFHATLSLFGQFLDEIGILWICLALIAFWWPKEWILIKSLRYKRSRHHLLMLVVGIFTTLLCFVKPEVNHLMLSIFAFPGVGLLIYHLKKHKSNHEFQALARSGLNSFLVAVTFWVLDQGLCQFWLNVHFPYLHGFWHVMISRATYKSCVAFSYCYALNESSCLPYLKYQHLPLSKNLGLWCVGFQQKRNEDFNKAT